MTKFILTVGVCLLAGSIAQAREVALSETPTFVSEDDQPGEDQTYEEGTKAMNEGRWSDAERAFRRTADMRGKRADGAIYWQAYVQNKEGRQSQARRSCAQLASGYAQSKWRSECDALMVEVRRGGDMPSGDDVSATRNPDDDIKMLALNSLMQQEPDRALPIVKSILLSNTQSTRLKERALFVLTQSQSKEAQDVLDQIARGKMDPELQVKAIHMMAAMKGKESAGFLNEIYKNSQNERVKDAALDGMFISGDASDLVTLAKAETDPGLKRKIVGKLSLMHGKEVTDYMLEILNK
jgi:hypothetical protein